MNHRWFPPEWHEQSAVMLTWPHAHSDWADSLQSVEPVFTEISYHVSLREYVVIVAYDENHVTHVRRLLQQRNTDLSQVKFFLHASNDSWARDHGPITVYEQQQPVLLDFIFNGWGNKYPSQQDNEISRSLRNQDAFDDLEMQSIDFVLEGGGVETDGEGTLLTTSQCLLAKTRNPNLSKTQIETQLQRQLSVERILWLDHGALAGDDTDSHIDTLARFCDANTIAYCYCNNQTDEHYQELQRMEQQLQTFRTVEGHPYQLERLPLPAAKFNADGQRLPATYANFLVINDAVLVPTYQDIQDEVALKALAKCFPQHKIIAIDCLPLIHQYGSLHCVTMQLPAGVVP